MLIYAKEKHDCHRHLRSFMFILRQYLVVVFRDKPLELWDIRTGTLLREMAKNFPTVTALVLKNTKKNLSTHCMYLIVTKLEFYLISFMEMLVK